MIRMMSMAAAVAAAAIAFVLWGGVRFDSDFVALYAAVEGVHHGLSPWDVEGQGELLTREFGRSEPYHLDAFAYPPWYVALTLPLGMVPFGEAGRLFLLFNLGCLIAGCYGMSAGWPARQRIWAGVAAAFYFPTVGLLAVGQYALPVFAGIGLGMFSLRRRNPWLAAASLFLLSFKWHLGILPGAGLLLLFARDRPLLRATLVPVLIVFGFAFATGFVFDASWPLSYAESVKALATAPVVSQCETCASLSWALRTRLDLSGGGGTVVVLTLLAAGAMAIWVRRLHQAPERFLAAVLALSFLALPYVRSYDYAVFVVALILAYRNAKSTAWRSLLVLSWLASFALTILPRDSADVLLGGTAVAVLVALLVQGPGAEDRRDARARTGRPKAAASA